MPTFGWFAILLHEHRPHETSSRPSGGPYPGEVEAGGTVAEEETKTSIASRKGPRRAESAGISTPTITCIWVSFMKM